MAERVLRVRVTSTVDKSLTDLLNKLDRYTKKSQVINVKAVIDSKEMTAFLSKIKKADNTTVNLKTVIKGDDVDKLKSNLKGIKDEKVNVDVKAPNLPIVTNEVKQLSTKVKDLTGKSHSFKFDEKGLKDIDGEFTVVDKKVKNATSKTHTLHFNEKGLKEIASNIDSLSSKILSVTGRAISSIGRGMVEEAGKLYDSQAGFISQASALGMDDTQIRKSINELADFGKTSKYSVAQVNDMAIALKGAGFDEAYGGFVNLTKGLGGFVSLAPNANTMFSKMAMVVQDLTPDGQVSKGQWNQLTRAAGGSAQKMMREFLKAEYGIDNINKAFREGQINGEMMMRTIAHVGNSPMFQQMATQTKTLSSAWDNFKESFVVELTGTMYEKGALTPVFDSVVQIVNKLQEATPEIAEFVGLITQEVTGTIFDALKNATVSDFINGLKAGLAPLRLFIKGVGQLFKLLTGGGKHIGTIMGLAVSFSALWLVGRKVFSLVKLFQSVGGIGALFGKGAKGSKSGAGGGNPLSGLNFQGLVNSLSNVTLLLGVAGSIKILASAMKDLDSVNMSSGEVAGKLLQMATVLGTTLGAFQLIGNLINSSKFKLLNKKDILTGAIALGGVATALTYIANEMEKLNGINFNFKDVSRELTQMGIVLGVSTVAISSIGAFLRRFKGGLVKDIAVGATALLGVSIYLNVLSRIMQGLNNIDFNFGDVARELTQMGIILGATMLALTGIGLILTAGGGVVAGLLGVGVIATLAIAGALTLLAGAMALMARGVEDFAKTVIRINNLDLPDAGVFNAKLLQLGELVLSLSALSFAGGITSFIGGIGGFLGAIGNLGQQLYLDSIVTLIDKVKRLIELADTAPTEGEIVQAVGKLTKLLTAMKTFDMVGESTGADFLVFWDSISDTLTNIAQGWEMDSLFNNLNKISEHIRKIQELPIPTDLSAVKQKITNLKNLMDELTQVQVEINNATGGRTATFSSNGSLGGVISSWFQGMELDNLIPAMEKLATFVQNMNKIPPIDSGVVTSVKEKMDNMKKVMKALKDAFDNNGDWDFGWLEDMGQAWGAKFQGDEINSLIKSFEKVVKFIESINKLEIDGSHVTAIQKKMDNIKKVMEELSKIKLDDIDVSSLDGQVITKIESIKKLVDAIKGVMDKLNEFTGGDISGKVEQIEKALTDLEGLAQHTAFTGSAFNSSVATKSEQISTFVTSLAQIVNNFPALLNTPDMSSIEEKVKQIKNALKELSSDDLLGYIAKFSGHDYGTLGSQVSTLVSSLVTVANDLIRLPDITGANVPSKLGQINSALSTIAGSNSSMGGSSGSILDHIGKMSGISGSFTEAVTAIQKITDIGNVLLTIPDIIDANIPSKVGLINGALAIIAGTNSSMGGGGGGSLLTYISNMSGMSGSFGDAVAVIQKITELGNALLTIPDLIDANLPSKIGLINGALQIIAGDGGMFTHINALSSKAETFASAITSVNKVTELANALLSIPNLADQGIVDKINHIKTALEAISQLELGDGVGLDNLQAVITKVNEISTAITSLVNTLPVQGTAGGTGFANSFISAVGTKLSDKVKQELEAIKALDWIGTGTTIANNLANGFSTGLGNKLSEKADQQRRAIEALDWAGTGSRISSAMANAFDISGILSKISQIQSAINSLQGKTVDVVVNHVTYKSEVKRQHGGIIPEYHSTGGTVGRGWKQSGTDTVPAMLTAGEYVLKRSVTSALGQQFLNALNSMNLTQALKHLASRTGNQVVNNTTNNITQNVDNKASFLNGLTELRGVVRP